MQRTKVGRGGELREKAKGEREEGIEGKGCIRKADSEKGTT